jgi:N-methylhydantoinase B
MTSMGDGSNVSVGNESSAERTVDPVTLAVIAGSLRSLVNEMNAALFRSAMSPVITEGRDVGGAVFDADGRLVAQGDWDLAVFVGMLEFSVADILRRFGPSLARGDVFLTNDPFVGGTHFNDVGVLRPVFDGDSLAGFVAIVGHWADVGGQEPGSLVANAREYYQEGLRIPPLRVVSAGSVNEGVRAIIQANMRLAEDRLGDLRAEIGATAVGAHRLEGLAAKYGWPELTRAMAAMIEHSERLIRTELAGIPDGTYEGEDSIDMQSLDYPEPRTVRVRMVKRGDSLTFDFRDSDEEARSACNSTLSATSSAVYVTVKSLFPSVPMNHGCFAPLEILTKARTIVDARPPAAVSSMAATVYEKVIGASLQAIDKAMPGRAVGCPYNLINLTIGGRAHDQEYVAYLYSEGGFGGRATKDGPAGLVSLYGGGAKITPVEVMERRYPIRFDEWGLWQDSGGAGRFRGGIGSRKTFRLIEGTARLSCLGDRERFPAFGIFGGESGAAHGLVLNQGTPGQKDLTLKAVGVELRSGDSVTILAGGGGGYGPPLERNPAAVATDVREGYISAGHAREHYGVVIREADAAVDGEATLKLRNDIHTGEVEAKRRQLS